MTCVAEIAPHAANTLAAQTTAVVDPTAAMMEPMHKERINCARKTMEDMMATSVPRPRTCCSGPSARTPSSVLNCGEKIINTVTV